MTKIHPLLSPPAPAKPPRKRTLPPESGGAQTFHQAFIGYERPRASNHPLGALLQSSPVEHRIDHYPALYASVSPPDVRGKRNSCQLAALDALFSSLAKACRPAENAD